MNSSVPTDLENFIPSLVTARSDSGPDEAAGEALLMFECHVELQREIQAEIDALDRGDNIDGEEVLAALMKKPLSSLVNEGTCKLGCF